MSSFGLPSHRVPRTDTDRHEYAGALWGIRERLYPSVVLPVNAIR